MEKVKLINVARTCERRTTHYTTNWSVTGGIRSENPSRVYVLEQETGAAVACRTAAAATAAAAGETCRANQKIEIKNKCKIKRNKNKAECKKVEKICTKRSAADEHLNYNFLIIQ